MGSDGGPDYREHYAALTRRLQSLRPLFSLEGSDSSFCVCFDEWLDANEFELALDALCDFLLEPTTPGITSAVLDEIDSLFRAMDLNDHRVTALQAKSETRFSSDLGL